MNTPAISEADLGALAEALLPLFPSSVTLSIDPHGARIPFRGPVVHHPGGDDGTGTHVVVEIEAALSAQLASMLPSDRSSSLNQIATSLRTQISARYSPDNVGPFALKFAATKELLYRE